MFGTCVVARMFRNWRGCGEIESRIWKELKFEWNAREFLGDYQRKIERQMCESDQELKNL